MNPATKSAYPEALRLAVELDAAADFPAYPRAPYRAAAATLRALHTQVAALTAVQPVAQDGALGLLKFNDDMGASITGLPAMTIKPGDEFLIFPKSPAQPAALQGVAYADAHGAIMGAAYDFRDAHISGSPNQKRSAHAALESAVTHALRASNGQAPAGAAEREFKQFLSDVMTAAGLVTHGNKCKALGDRLAEMCMRLRCPTAQAAPAAGAVAGPEWKLVPVEPTDDMLRAIRNQRSGGRVGAGDRADWAAWLAAAPTPPAQAADSVLEDAARLERERICAAIKAEDDYCVDQGNYMLDSDDCIKIVRGEWVRPDFAVDAASKQGATHD